MAVRHNNLGEDGSGEFPYAEIDHMHLGDSYVVRVTAIPPYRTALADALLCHVDWMNVTQGTSGRYAAVTLPPKTPADNNQRRHSMLRFFTARRGSGSSIPSPVFP